MRIAVATRYVTRVGGVESYLAAVLPELAARGHDVTVWYEDASAGGGADRIVPEGFPTLRLSPDTIAAADRSETPDVIFLHGLSDPALNDRLTAIAPVVICLHNYDASCISGTKTLSFPSPVACSRALGPGCLLQYVPRHCGGWSPVTMVESYVRRRRRQSQLRSCRFVVTLSEHMRKECIAQGVAESRAVRLPLFTPPDRPADRGHRVAPTGTDAASTGRWHLLFAGRMETLKGGQLLLDALDLLTPTLRQNLRVSFAGDGRARARWEQHAAHVSRGEVEICFVGQLPRPAMFNGVDLLVVPSLWPEPLGLIGLEAAAEGVPAVAFDLGGIREWLRDGVTGRLVPAAPASSTKMARAIEECLAHPTRLREWGEAARAASRLHLLGAHIDALETVLVRAGRSHAEASPELLHA